MKLNVSYPATGCQKLFDIRDEHRVRMFYDKRIGAEVQGDDLGDEWAGYIFTISGGNDKQGFPMMQGVLCNRRVSLLLGRNHSCYRPRRDGQRRRKSVRGCFVDANLSVSCLVIVRKGINEIPGLTDTVIPRRLGPKRASHIRKLFNLSREDDVRQYVVKRPLVTKIYNKARFKAPKIQRLITPKNLQRKRHRLVQICKSRLQSRQKELAYKKFITLRQKELRLKQKQLRKKRTRLSDVKTI